MRRVATALVVAAVAAVVGVAALDALRGDEAPPPDEGAAIEGRERLAEELADLGVEDGLLVYTDPACRSVHATSLPGLEGRRRPRGGIREQCSLSLSPDGETLAAPHWHWSPDGASRAACRGRAFVDVFEGRGGPDRTVAGCSPAWTPSGLLTVVREGAVVRAVDGVTVVPRGALLEAAARHPATPASGRIARVDVLDAAWLTDERIALALTVHYPDGRVLPQQLVAAFEADRLAWSRPLPGPPPTRLSTGRDGRYLLVEPRALLDADGRAIPLPPALRSAHALALSPDGRLLAAAVRDSVEVHEVGGLGRSVRLPIAARDLAWR